jgi:hypothetical protein
LSLAQTNFLYPSQVLTGLRPYAGHLRDDFAGIDSVRGLAPGNISQLDNADKLGERSWIPRESNWISNGIWHTINKCWSLDPLLRPSAAVFLRTMERLNDRNESWKPEGVMDLAGKVKKADQVHDQMGIGMVWANRSQTIWLLVCETRPDKLNKLIIFTLTKGITTRVDGG